jgi:hypothetical protein
MNTEARTFVRPIRGFGGINRDPDLVFASLSDPAIWPQWDVVNLESVAGPDRSAWPAMMTPHGPAKLRNRPDARYASPITTGTIAKRVGRRLLESSQTARARNFMMTFFQPATFSDSFFDEQIKLIDIKLTRLKQTLET